MSGIERHGAGRAAFRLHPDLAYDALVLVALPILDPHILTEDHLRQTFLGSLAEGLGFLGGVDARQANLVLMAVGIEDGYRVAIGNAHHAAKQGVGVGDTDQQCR